MNTELSKDTVIVLVAISDNARRLHDKARSVRRIGGRSPTLPPKSNRSKSAMCGRASIRVNHLSKYPRFRLHVSGSVSRLLSDVRLICRRGLLTRFSASTILFLGSSFTKTCAVTLHKVPRLAGVPHARNLTHCDNSGSALGSTAKHSEQCRSNG